jgi:hypothetical protein
MGEGEGRECDKKRKKRKCRLGELQLAKERSGKAGESFPPLFLFFFFPSSSLDSTSAAQTAVLSTGETRRTSSERHITG